jgi:hypothetical protein
LTTAAPPRARRGVERVVPWTRAAESDIKLI